MKMRTIVTVALTLFVNSAWAAERLSWGVVTGDDVNVRSGAAKAFREMGQLGKDDVVEILAISNDGKWTRIVAPGSGSVWISAEFVDVKGEKGTLTGDNVRVRVRPELKSEVVNQLNRGAVVNVKGREGEWIKVAPPAGTVAWIHAEYVKRLTDAELAAFETRKAEEARRERERREREAARLAKLRQEAERKKREAQMIAGADKLFAAELAKDIRARSLDKALRAYQEVERKVKNPQLRGKSTVSIVVIRDMQRVQAAIRKKAKPGPLSKFDFASAKTTYGVHRAVDDLLAAHLLAQKIAKEAESRIARQPTSDGWIFYLSPGLEHTGATHTIVENGQVKALVRSGRIDLNAFVGRQVRIAGKLAGQVQLASGKKKTNIIDVARAEPLFK